MVKDWEEAESSKSSLHNDQTDPTCSILVEEDSLPVVESSVAAHSRGSYNCYFQD